MMEAIQTDRGVCFTPNRFSTLCGLRLREDIPHTFTRVIERTHQAMCRVCHDRWEKMEMSQRSLKFRVACDEWVYEEHDLD